MDSSSTDYGHPLSEKTSNTEEQKSATLAAAITDPSFPLPTVDESSSTTRRIQSFTVLTILIIAGLFGAWVFEASILQAALDEPVVLALSLGGLAFALFLTGTVWIDWWELVLGYWWLVLPVVGVMMAMILIMQETATDVKDMQ